MKIETAENKNKKIPKVGDVVKSNGDYYMVVDLSDLNDDLVMYGYVNLENGILMLQVYSSLEKLFDDNEDDEIMENAKVIFE